MKNNNRKVSAETLRENIKKFLLYCNEKDINPVVTRYNQFIREKNLRGMWQTVEKRTNGFVEERKKIAEKIGFKLKNYTRYWSDKEIYEGPKKCFSEIKDLKYLVYENWRKQNDYPSACAIRNRIGETWRTIRKMYGDEPKTPKRSTKKEIAIGSFCRDCLHYKNCDYNYNLKKCKWYEEG